MVDVVTLDAQAADNGLAMMLQGLLAENLATSDAWFDIKPMQPANGNISAAASTPASAQHEANFTTVFHASWRSAMILG